MEHLCLSTGRDNFSLPGQAQAYPGLPLGQVNGDDHTDLDATLSDLPRVGARSSARPEKAALDRIERRAYVANRSEAHLHRLAQTNRYGV